MKTRCIVVLALLLPALGFAGDAQAPAGNRPDSRSMFFSLERTIIKNAERLHGLRKDFADSLDELTREHEREVEELVSKWEQAPDRGLPLFTDSKGDYNALIKEANEERAREQGGLEDRYGQRLDDQRVALGNALASPPDRASEDKLGLYRPYSASREQLELYNAAMNLQKVANELTARLRGDRANYALAAATYDVMLEMLIAVTEMNTSFAMRVDQKYKPEARDLMKRIREAKTKTENARGVEADIVKRELEKLSLLYELMQQNQPRLDEMKAWSERNAASLEPILNTVRLLKDNATVVRDAADWVGGIEESFAQLNVSLPPLVEYDLIESDFVLNTPDLELEPASP